MSDDSTARSIRGLTVAVWALVAVIVVGILVPVLWGLALFGMRPGEIHPVPATHMPASIPIPAEPYVDETEGFHDWPIEKQIAAASAIVLTKYSSDGEKLTSTVSEILKLAPGTTLYYKVGDEFTSGSRYLREGVTYGEGEIVFFVGSPAEMRFSTSYEDGRCGGLADIPIETLKKMIAAQNQKSALPDEVPPQAGATDGRQPE